MTKWLLLGGFAVIYFVWGSTYLAIKWTVGEIPPFLMMGCRFSLAGAMLLAYAKPKQISRAQVWHGLVLGMTMVVLGTGVVGWVESYIPSGLTALLVSVSPIWMMAMDAVVPGGRVPGRKGVMGAFLGLFGSALLVGSDVFQGTSQWIAVAVLVGSTWMWSLGSLFARYHKVEAPPLVLPGLQMFIGGCVLMLIAAYRGEWVSVSWRDVSVQAWSAWAYLVVFGSVLVFPTYVWLMRVSTPSRVSTHAFVNPVIAVLLGWLVGV